MAETITVGRIVAFFDASGNLKPAIVTAVRDLKAEKVRLSVIEGTTLTDQDNVVRKNPPTPTSWHFLDEPRYG